MNAHIETKSTKWLSQVAYQTFIIFGGVLFLVLCSLCRFPLWFTPVPVTLQTFAILLMGAFLGSRKAPIAALIYLGCGSFGLPFFSTALGGATTGYLLGFVLATFLVGLLFERGAARHVTLTALTFLVGSLVIQLCGVLWLGSLIGFKQALVMGFYPFIIVDLAKVVVATGICSARWKLKKS